MAKESTYSKITPVLTDYLRAIDNPAGTPVTANVEITDLLTLLKANIDISPPDSCLISFTQFRAFHSDGAEFEPTYRRLYSIDMFDTTGANGDYFTANVYLAAGTYTLNANYWRSSVAGKFDVYVDGVKENSTSLDAYAASPDYANQWDVTGIEITADGVHEIKFVANGKNASSSGYRSPFGLMSMYRTA